MRFLDFRSRSRRGRNPASAVLKTSVLVRKPVFFSRGGLRSERGEASGGAGGTIGGALLDGHRAHVTSRDQA
jgi:hypothetical protein